MNHLVPCPECRRHVRVTETECPFCARPLDLAGTPEPQLPRVRLGRAATFAFGATLASLTAVVSCGGEATENPSGSAGTTSGAGTSAGGAAAGTGGNGNAGTSTIVPPYGVPPFAGSGGVLYGLAPDDAGGPDDASAGAGGVPK